MSGADPEAGRLLTDDRDRPPAVIGRRRPCLVVLVGRDEIADRTRQLRHRTAGGEGGVDDGHLGLERRLVGIRPLHPVLQEERAVAGAGEPAGDLEALVGPRVDRPPAARHDDDPDAVGAIRSWLEDRQRRIGDVAQERRPDRQAGRRRVRDLVADAIDPGRRAVGPQADDLDGVGWYDRGGSHGDMIAPTTTSPVSRVAVIAVLVECAETLPEPTDT